MIVPAEVSNREHDLRSLLEGMAVAPALTIGGIQDNSRLVREGDVFLACQGATCHGLDFAESAILAGAVAIVWDSTTGDPAIASAREACAQVPFIGVANLASKLADVANRWYDWPSHSIEVVGVTGTNGKTTVAYLVSQGLQLLHQSAGYIGTLGFGINELDVDLGMTTPPCLDLHAKMAAFRDLGATAAAIEVSSHALAQARVGGVRFDTVVFTNLSRDHVDYHGDMQAYAESKARLFTEYESRHRIIAVDTEFGQELASRCGPAVTVTSIKQGSDLSEFDSYVVVRSLNATDVGSELSVESSWGNGRVHVAMPGDFNVSNALQVLAVLLVRGVDFDRAARTIAALSAPPGRLQRVRTVAANAPKVYVDYAHTPDALRAVLGALRPHTHGRIFCVFGCGGDRDHGKRPEMGAVVSSLADKAIITNDNPRSESPSEIIAAIEVGMAPGAVVIEDRAAAIAWAIREAASGDVVLIAGKGHEDYQIIGDRRIDFSDYQIARANLKLSAADSSGGRS